jgi:Icc-related predicted phosphoesterase
MKLFCTSDLHGKLDGLDPSNCDLVVIAGDFAKMTGWGKWHIYDMKKWIEKKFIPFTQQFNIPFVIVPGNHDLIFDNSKICSFSDVNYQITWPENVHILIDKQVEINGLTFYGTPYVPIINYCWAFEANYEKLNEKFANIPENIDILVTHTPPRIPEYLGDMSLEYGLNSEKFGSSELANAIFDKNPKYVFCGHIHSGSHEAFCFNNTIIYNVSRVNESYNIQYEPTIITIDK